MTQFNINVLLVVDESESLTGYITRQVVEKAVYFGLGAIPSRNTPTSSSPPSVPTPRSKRSGKDH